MFGVGAVQFFRSKAALWLILALAAIATIIYLFVVMVASPAAPIVASAADPILGPGFFRAFIMTAAAVIFAGISYMFYYAFSSRPKAQKQNS